MAEKNMVMVFRIEHALSPEFNPLDRQAILRKVYHLQELLSPDFRVRGEVHVMDREVNEAQGTVLLDDCTPDLLSQDTLAWWGSEVTPAEEMPVSLMVRHMAAINKCTVPDAWKDYDDPEA